MIFSEFDAYLHQAYLCHRHGIAVEASDAFLRLTGYERAELLGLNVLYILNNQLRINKRLYNIDEIASDKSFFIFNKDMDFREVYIKIQPCPQGQAIYLVFEQQPFLKMNNALNTTHHFMADTLNCMALYSAEDYTLLKASREYKKSILNRYNKVDIIGRKVNEFYIGWQDSIAKKNWEEAIAAGKTVINMEHENINPTTGNLEYFDASVTPIIDCDKVKFLAVSLNNVTDRVNLRKENQEKAQMIEKQNKQLEAIVENMPDAIFIFDKQDNLILSNKAAKASFNTIPNNLFEAFGMARYYERNGMEVPLDETPAFQMQKGINVYDRIIVMKTEVSSIIMSVNATPMFDEAGNYKMGIVSCRDVTEYMIKEDTINAQQQAHLQAEKKEKENLEKLILMKDEFLSLISHEFKTPLTVINSALQAMEFLYKDQLTDSIVKYLDRIKQNTYRQVRLVNNLLDITGANAGHMKLNMKNRDIVSLTRMLVESVSIYANQKGVKIQFESKCKQKFIAVDEEKYERILLNLLSNAIKFTPRDKAITVEIICKKDEVLLKVADEGIGIPKEKHDIIFERFGQVDSSYTRQAEGSGIGLSLVKLIVQAMNGKIYVESEVGVGSSFFVELPVTKVSDELYEEKSKQLIDSRLIQSIAVEFSDIYF